MRQRAADRCSRCPHFWTAAAALAAIAASSLSSDAQERTEKISVDDARPVAAAIELLAKRYNRAITYEDPRYLYEGDIKDVTREVRKDLDRYPPGKAPRVLVPRGGQLAFTYRVSDDAGGQPADWEAALDSLLTAQAARGGPRFRLEHHADVDHVIPAASRDASGRWVAAEPILDVSITIPEQQLSRLAIVEAVAKAIGEAAHVQLGIGTCLGCGPHSLAPDPTFAFGVSNERGRDVLWRVLQEWRAGAAWRIFEDPQRGLYLLNVFYLAPAVVVPAQPPSVLPSPPEANGDSVCRPTPATVKPVCGR